MQRLSIKSHWSAQALDAKRVVLLAEDSAVLLRGEVYPALVPLLDGTRTEEQIIDALAERVPPAHVCLALHRMSSCGHIAPTVEDVEPAESTFWHSAGYELEDIRAARHRASVQVSGSAIPECVVRDLVKALKGNGIRYSPQGVQVLLVDDYLNPALEDVHRDCMQAGTAWLPAKPVGSTLWVGPYLHAGNAHRFEDLQRRLREQRPYVAAMENAMEGHGRVDVSLSWGALSVTTGLAVQLACMEICKLLLIDDERRLEDAVLTLDTLGGELRYHELPRPRAVGNTLPEPVRLESRAKGGVRDGGHRIATPEETLARLEAHVSPITGIIPGVVRVETAPDVHLYQATQREPERIDPRQNRGLGRPSAAAGKGASDAQAKVSCLAEAIERYSSCYQGNEHRRHARLDEVEGAVSPDELLLFSERQYALRDEWNRAHPGFSWIAEPFDAERPIDWAPAWSLTHDRRRWLPTAYTYIATPLPDEHIFCRGDSNGCASGNCLEEAILQGFFELVERDSIALWWYNRLLMPRVDVASFESDYAERMIAHYRREGKELHVLDLTSDLEIPVMVAVSCGASGESLQLGFGADLDAKVALHRALSEHNQMAIFSPHASNNGTDWSDGYLQRWLTSSTTETEPYVLPRPGSLRSASDYAPGRENDLHADVHTCIERLRARGLEMIIKDLTRTEIDFSVARVTVPGLRHFWARFAPGRLYDVPVALAWRDRPCPEDELNPIPFFL